MAGRLEEKLVWVTGGSRGIGAAIAHDATYVTGQVFTIDGGYTAT